MLLVKTKLGQSNISGIGLFADEFISEGTIVWTFNSLIDQSYPIVFMDRFPKLLQDFIKRYGFRRDDDTNYILCGDHGRFVNHSIRPNCIEADNGDSIAARDIAIGEEITENYFLFNADFNGTF